MDDKFEKKLKEFLPYIIIIGVVYLFAPALLVFTKSTGLLNQIVYLGLFPLTALLCNLYYSYKKTSDFALSLVAPIIYIPSMLLYGNIRDSLLNSLIYLVSYFICGYIGLTLGEMIKGSNSKSKKSDVTRKRVPTVVDTSTAQEPFEMYVDDIELPKQYEQTEDYTQYEDTYEEPAYEPASSYTEDDIDAILAELRNRHE
ncbi:MAG: hypothetical protein IJ331_01535 [Ruminococcus sp.]|nr:hypothetical protein [Ruminococcus sp.]